MTQAELIPVQAETVPDVVCESIRKLFPHPRNKQAEMAAVRRALDRLVQGERDGSPATLSEAVAFLRIKLEEAARSMYGREKKYVPHLTTFLNQSRYLVSAAVEAPPNLAEAIDILKLYPGVTLEDSDYQAHLPVLRVIDAHIEFYKATHGAAAASYIRQRVFRYGECVAKWPEEDLQFIPNPMKFFQERRYEQPDSRWVRKPSQGFGAERQQIDRLVSSMGRS